jgi:hypothetical protein
MPRLSIQLEESRLQSIQPTLNTILQDAGTKITELLRNTFEEIAQESRTHLDTVLEEVRPSAEQIERILRAASLSKAKLARTHDRKLRNLTRTESEDQGIALITTDTRIRPDSPEARVSRNTEPPANEAPPLVQDKGFFVTIGNVGPLLPSEERVLGKGLNFCPTQGYDRITLGKDVFEFVRRLRLREFYSNSDETRTATDLIGTIVKKHIGSTFIPDKNRSDSLEAYIAAIKSDIFHSANSQKAKTWHNLSKGEHTAFKGLCDNDSIVIKQADKGGKIVVMEKTWYTEKIKLMLEDQTFYRALNEIEANNLQDDLKSSLRQLCDELKEDRLFRFLHVEEPSVARYYGLPKLHKPDIPLRPIVSACGSATEQIGLFIDELLGNTMTMIPTYVRDTPHFIDLLREVTLPSDSSQPLFLVTMDVSALYNNIPHDDGVAATVGYYEQLPMHEQPISAEQFSRLLKLALMHNVFEFDNQKFLQVHGVAMGAKFAPRYACCFMGNLELKFFQKQEHLPVFYVRFIDDIFMIWHGNRESLEHFIAEFNVFHSSIKLTHEISQNSVNFLDLTVTINGNKLSTSLYTKPTSSPQYLSFESQHPHHTKTSLPYSQFIRCRRSCTYKKDAIAHMNRFSQLLEKRGYPKSLLSDAKRKVLKPTAPRRQARRNINRTNLVVTFSSSLPDLNMILRRHYHLLERDAHTKRAFPTPPAVTYRRASNIQDRLVNARLCKGGVKGSCKPCGNKKCLICRQMDTTTYVRSTDGKFTHYIPGNYNCSTNNCVYMLQCSLCNKRYIGQTSTSFRYRFNNHKAHCKTQAHLPITQHVNKEKHPFSAFRVTILKAGFRGAKDRELFESILIRRFNTDVNGLNSDAGLLKGFI